MSIRCYFDFENLVYHLDHYFGGAGCFGNVDQDRAQSGFYFESDHDFRYFDSIRTGCSAYYHCARLALVASDQTLDASRERLVGHSQNVCLIYVSEPVVSESMAY